MAEENAPAPEVMREEFINIVVAHTGGKITRTKAEQVVDLILSKQMAFYAQMAEPELTADPAEQMALVSDTAGIVGALVVQGARWAEHMLPEDRLKWQQTAERARALIHRMSEMFS